jgi:DNA-directed RNA polymerase subunit M/transcription elongation factor TFIIS
MTKPDQSPEQQVALIPLEQAPAPVTPKQKIVNFKCRRPGCTCMTAEAMSKDGDLARLYRCTQCNHTQVINTGGHFPI